MYTKRDILYQEQHLRLTCCPARDFEPLLECGDGTIEVRIAGREGAAQQSVYKHISLLVREFLQPSRTDWPQSTSSLLRQRMFLVQIRRISWWNHFLFFWLRVAHSIVYLVVPIIRFHVSDRL